jgi:hypothetical protein
MGPLLLTIGLTLSLLGLLMTFLEKSGLRKLPGDILIEKGNVSFFFPITTAILLSLLLTILLNLFLHR